MRVMFVTDALAIWGGIERVLSDKANMLVRDYGCEVYVVTTDQGSHPIPYFLDARIQMIDLNIRFHQQYKFHGLKRFKKYREYESLFRSSMRACLEDIKPDVISCFRDGNVLGILDVKGSIPLIFESHAMYKDVQYERSTLLHRFVSYINRIKFRKLDKLVTLTKGDADDWSKVCKNICVIPNVVHLNETNRYSNCNNKKAIFAGRFNLQKDYSSLLKIWEQVQKRYPDWILEVYGNGNLKPLYENLVSDKKLNVKIHSAVPDIFDKYMESSMLLMTSLYEPFGLVLVEAMSCGLPVVAFNCPYGPADIISDGIDGYLVEDRNITEFVERVCFLIDNQEQRLKMGKAAISSAQRYKAENVMPQWISLFEQLSMKTTINK